MWFLAQKFKVGIVIFAAKRKFEKIWKNSSNIYLDNFFNIFIHSALLQIHTYAKSHTWKKIMNLFIRKAAANIEISNKETCTLFIQDTYTLLLWS